jgi:hypothetical protein
MASFMTRQSFNQLALIRRGLIENGFPSTTADRPGLAGLFVPWSGQHLAERGNIY